MVVSVHFMEQLITVCSAVCILLLLLWWDAVADVESMVFLRCATFVRRRRRTWRRTTQGPACSAIRQDAGSSSMWPGEHPAWLLFAYGVVAVEGFHCSDNWTCNKYRLADDAHTHIVHTHMHADTRSHTEVRHAHGDTNVHAHIHTATHACTHTHRVVACARARTHRVVMHTHMHAHTQSHTHTHSHTPTHMHTVTHTHLAACQQEGWMWTKLYLILTWECEEQGLNDSCQKIAASCKGVMSASGPESKAFVDMMISLSEACQNHYDNVARCKSHCPGAMCVCVHVYVHLCYMHWILTICISKECVSI